MAISFEPGKKPEAIVIGASAGGVELLTDLFSKLPLSMKIPIFAVLHIHPDSRSMMALFQKCCSQKILEPQAGEAIDNSTVYVAPPDYHMLVENRREIALATFRRVNYCRPAIDPLFFSAAQVYRERLLGIVLTGANDDGSRGLASVRQAGGTTVVQDPEVASVRTMPLAASPYANHALDNAGLSELLQAVTS